MATATLTVPPCPHRLCLGPRLLSGEHVVAVRILKLSSVLKTLPQTLDPWDGMRNTDTGLSRPKVPTSVSLRILAAAARRCKGLSRTSLPVLPSLLAPRLARPPVSALSHLSCHRAARPWVQQVPPAATRARHRATPCSLLSCLHRDQQLRLQRQILIIFGSRYRQRQRSWFLSRSTNPPLFHFKTHRPSNVPRMEADASPLWIVARTAGAMGSKVGDSVERESGRGVDLSKQQHDCLFRYPGES